jgi:hypothetical protein
MTDAAIIQRSPEWFAARCGSLGASQLADALAKTKSGWGASRANLAGQARDRDGSQVGRKKALPTPLCNGDS